MTEIYDLAIVGGGVMGCSAALRATEGGMKVLVIEQSELGSGASGVNAGTLSLQIKRVKLMPYALKGYEWWRKAGAHVGFHRTGGYTLAFTTREADLLVERMTMKREAGAPVEMVSPNQVLAAEPGLSRRIVAASYCVDDGYANSSVTGVYFRQLLREAGAPYIEQARVQSITRDSGLFELALPDRRIKAKRLLLACGAWLKDAARMVGLELPVNVRINTVSVTEKAPKLVGAVIGHATGLLTLKQKANGTILIGGGWQGEGAPSEGRGRVVADSLLTNLRLAAFAVPALKGARVLRSWTGFEPGTPDAYPLMGALPGVENGFVVGCVRGGYTIGPLAGRLIADAILGREPELPLFNPGRFSTRAEVDDLREHAS